MTPAGALVAHFWGVALLFGSVAVRVLRRLAYF